MINLIPPEGHKNVRREYLFRLIATTCLFLAFIITVLSFSLVPTYVLIDAQISTIKTDGQKSDEEDIFVQAEEEIQSVQKIVHQLNATPTALSASDIITLILRETSSAIILKGFSTVSEGGRITGMSVQGIAQTREALAKYIKNLEKTGVFKTVEVPITDLVRDVNLTFMMSTTLSEKN